MGFRLPSIRLGRIMGIPIRADLGVAVLAVAVAFTLGSQLLPFAFPERSVPLRWGAAVVGALGFVASVLLHELGHAVAARRHGMGVRGITLWVLGGQAELDRLADSPRAEFDVAAAGPAVNAALAGVFSVVAWWIHQLSGARIGPGVLAWLAIINIVIAVSNLIPVAPLDGGRILTAWIWARRGDAERARIITARLGLGVGVAAIVGAVLWAVRSPIDPNAVLLAVTGFFLVPGARSDLISAVIRRRLATTRMADVMSRLAPPVAVDDQATRVARLDDGTSRGTVAGVVRWTHEPVGFVTVASARRLDAPAASMTRVESLMTPVRELARARADEPVADVISRLELFSTEAVIGPTDPIVVEDWDDRRVGGVTPVALAPLLTPPNWWGHTIIDSATPTG